MGDSVGEAKKQVARGEDFARTANLGFGTVMGGITIMAMAEERPEKGSQRRKAQRPYGDLRDRKCQKRRGEIAEAFFLAKAAAMGFAVATPWGDSGRYDLIVDTGARLLRVQVKSAHRMSKRGGGYHVRAHPHKRRPYRVSEIDLLVAYVVPEEAWYVFPPRAFRKMKSMALYPTPGKKKSKFEEYREAWEWFEDAR